MPIRNVVISEYGVEENFLIAFVKSIMSETVFTSNHTLVCKIGANGTESNAVTVTTAAEVETQMNTAYSQDSNSPTIWFIIDTYTKIKIARGSLSESSSSMPFYTYFSGIAGNTESLVYSETGRPRYTETTTRVWKYRIISNDNALHISFGGITDGYVISIFSYKKNSEIVCGNNIASTLRSTNSQPLEAVNRLEYKNNISNPTAIETIQNKVVVSSSLKEKVITMDNVWDSTYSEVLMYEVNVTANNQTISAVYLNRYTVMPI